jgi:hypothetical protein
MRPTERAIGMEEGEGRESRHLTICFSNSHRNPHYICDSNFFANIISIFITIPIFDSNSDSINSARWLLRREVE